MGKISREPERAERPRNRLSCKSPIYWITYRIEYKKNEEGFFFLAEEKDIRKAVDYFSRVVVFTRSIRNVLVARVAQSINSFVTLEVGSFEVRKVTPITLIVAMIFILPLVMYITYQAASSLVRYSFPYKPACDDAFGLSSICNVFDSKIGSVDCTMTEYKYIEGKKRRQENFWKTCYLNR